MIVDSSALVAVIRQESDAWALHRALSLARRARMSAANYVEASVVIDGACDPVASREVDRYLAQMDVEVVSFTPDQARIARDAYRDFGRGSGHPAKLNLGDCFAYALAKDTGEPLLFKGDDFVHTDVIPAVPR
jgi:ribonuclease VapC